MRWVARDCATRVSDLRGRVGAWICRGHQVKPTGSFRGDEEMTTQNGSAREKSNRGFASMDPSKQREIASKGGRAAHAQGRAHEFTTTEARTAGQKGGEMVSRDRTHMAAIGRAGGQARGRNRTLQAVRTASPRVEAPAQNGAGSGRSSDAAAE
jgi:general stress protein YciG